MLWCKSQYFRVCSQESIPNYTRKSQIGPSDETEIVNKSICGTHLRKLSTMDLTVQMDAKSGKLLNESELFSAPVDARETANASDKCKCVCSALEGKI